MLTEMLMFLYLKNALKNNLSNKPDMHIKPRHVLFAGRHGKPWETYQRTKP